MSCRDMTHLTLQLGLTIRQIDEIKQRWAAAAPGPWGEQGYRVIAPEASSKLVAQVYATEGRECLAEMKSARANAEAIAHAPEDIAWLLRLAKKLYPKPCAGCPGCPDDCADALDVALFKLDWLLGELQRRADEGRSNLHPVLAEYERRFGEGVRDAAP